MSRLVYLTGYAPQIVDRVQTLLDQELLSEHLRTKYPVVHQVVSPRALYDFTSELKARFLRQSKPLSKVAYDDKIHVIEHALGTHTFVSRVQGSKLKAKNEIRVASVFKRVPIEFLRMIVVHELAHLKEKEHNKAFYRLCEYMEPEYHQYEFDMRLYLTHLDLIGSLW